MIKEFQPAQPRPQPIEKVQQRLDKVTQLLPERANLKACIGIEGQVQVSSSDMATLKMGRVRNSVDRSISRLKNEQTALQGEVAGYTAAEKFIEVKRKKQEEMAEVSEQVSKDGSNSKTEHLMSLQRDYNEFMKSVAQDQNLQKGVARIEQEDADAKKYLQDFKRIEQGMEQAKLAKRRGQITEEELKEYIGEYNALYDLPDKNIALKKGIIRVRRREEERIRKVRAEASNNLNHTNAVFTANASKNQ
jgi:hypothetical protein